MNCQKTLLQSVKEYLSYRRNLGYELKTEGVQLLQFAHFSDTYGDRGCVTIATALKWSKKSKKANLSSCARRLNMVRRFAKHQILLDPRTEVPPEGLFGSFHRRPTPHIYSQQEIKALITAASNLGPAGSLRPHTFVTLIGLLACTGLRISEALALKRQDVNLQTGVLTIRVSKFKKSRLVPLHDSAVKNLQAYVHRRDRYHRHPHSDAFFLNEHTTPMKHQKTNHTFRQLRKNLGWTAKGQESLPRIHDLRHTFAVQRLLQWHQEDAVIDHKIVGLATYLGHVNVTSTYWYLSAIPELMAVISKRFEQFAKH